MARALYKQVSEIANSMSLSTAKKEKRISTAVRVAVVAATAYKNDPDVVLGIALELAQVASRAAPHFAGTIASAVSFAPSVSRIEGASSRIRTAAFAAAAAPRGKRAREIPSELYVQAPHATAEEVAAAPGESTQQAPMPENSTEAPTRAAARPAPEAGVAESEMPAPAADQMAPEGNGPDNGAASGAATSRITEGDNSKLAVTANVMVQHDDNIFISNSDKVADTIYSFEPGLDFHVGQNSLDHASLSYQEDFVEYASHKAPNVHLANAAGDFGYDDGGLKLAANGSYQQLYQNNIDVLTIGPNALIRSNNFLIGGNGEWLFGAKTSGSVGVSYNDVTYANPGLVGGRNLNFPVDLYYKVTPKADVFAGYTYGIYRPDEGGPEAKDGYAHVGARGDFTPKLSGSFSVGYITRNVPGTVRNKSLGYTGNLTYEVTPKTNATMSFSRDFTATALGQTEINSSYSLGLSTALSPQWEIGESINYQILDYGPQVFLLNNSPITQERRDDYWTGNLHLTYIYSRWLTASAGYTARNDHSTISLIDFADNVFSLTMGLRY